MGVQTLGRQRHRVRLNYKGQRYDEVIVGTKRQAETKLAKKRIEMAEGSYVDHKLGQMKFADYVEEIFVPSREGIKPSSAEREGYVISRMLRRWSKRPLASITKSDLRKFLDESPNSESTKIRERGILHLVFQVAADEGLIQVNPATGLKRARKRRTNEEQVEKTYPSHAEVQALIDHMEPRFRAMMMCMAWAGLRPGEAAALRRCDIDMERSEITVRKTVFEPTSGPPVLTSPKTEASQESVEIPVKLKQALAAHILQYGVTEGLLFPGETGEPLRLRNWRRRHWAKACKAAGVVTHPHSLRHFYVSALIHAGIPIERVSRMARHESPMLTWKVYSHEFKRLEGEVSPAVQALDAMMK